MPEFQMNTDGEVAGKTWEDLPEFVRGYLEACFFTNVAESISMVEYDTPEVQEVIREGQSDGEIPGDADLGDIYPGSLQTAIEECEAFQTEAKALLDLAYQRNYDEAQAGRDFWFTRCGHGVGFWDRDELEADELGDKLTAVAETYGNRDASFGQAADGSESPTGYGFVFIE
jgi:hypothetical protein